jgi:5'-3' exonuclease
MAKKIKRLGLLDLDIFAFQAAAVGEEEVILESEVSGHVESMLWSPLGRLLDQTIGRIDELAKQLKLDKTVVCITDSANWRTDVLPSYKSNRKGTRKPLGLNWLKEQLADHYESFKRPSLEADDVMGILATWDGFYPDYRKIIVSEDKDMKTIPAWLYNPAKDFEPWLQTPEDADKFHLMQTLAGDITDGYDGCPSIGMGTAEELLDAGLKFESYEHVFKTGARKGQSEIRWRKVESESPWATVVSCYLKQGLTEESAIQQARVARICRSTDYDFRKKEVKLWLP